MTSNESFRKRVRARMARTGVRYVAARRALIDQASRDEAAGSSGWVSQPEVTDEAVTAATGRGWDDWVAVVEADPVADAGHTAVAAWLRDQHDLDPWWSQTVTGGWERIRGRRLPGQMPNGTFAVSRSRTLDVDRDELHAALVHEDGLAVLFPTVDVALRSRPTTKAPRLALPEGVAIVGLDERRDGRVRVGVRHQGLPSPAAMELWASFWEEWLTSLVDA